MRKLTPEEQAQGVKEVQLCFKLNNTMPFTKEYDELVHEIFGEFGEGSRLMAPTSVVRGKNVKIGKYVVIQTNSLFMSAGGKEKGMAEGEGSVINAAEGLKKIGINAHSYISPETAHEWQTWRRSLYQFAQLLFK